MASKIVLIASCLLVFVASFSIREHFFPAGRTLPSPEWQLQANCFHGAEHYRNALCLGIERSVGRGDSILQISSGKCKHFRKWAVFLIQISKPLWPLGPSW